MADDFDDIQGPFSEHLAAHPDADPVQELFQLLPAPQEDAYPRLLRSLPGVDKPILLKYDVALNVFEHRIEQGMASSDPDFDHLVEAYKATSGPDRGIDFLAELGSLGLSKSENLEEDDSLKSQQLAYYRWIARGRKDEEFPLPPWIMGEKAPPESHDFLPAETKTKKCASCDKTVDKSFRCAGCIVTTEGRVAFQTVYCGKECQKADWEHHKASCRELSALHRAVSIFQDLFLHLFAKLYRGRLRTIWVDRNGMIKVLAESDDADIFTGSHLMTEFFNAWGVSKEVSEAVMLLDRVEGIFDDAWNLFRALVQPFCAKVETLMIVPKNIHTPIKWQNCTGGSSQDLPRHGWMSSFWTSDVLRLTLPSGLEVAFHPTAAQYGWRDYMVPWSKFAEHRIAAHQPPILHESPANQPISLRRFRDPSDGSLGRETQSTRQEAAALTALTMLKHAVDVYGNWKAFINLKASHFNYARAVLVAQGMAKLESHAQKLKDSKKLKLFATVNCNEVTVTFEDNEYDLLKNVWLSKEEYEKLEYDFDALHKLWRERYEAAMDVEDDTTLPSDTIASDSGQLTLVFRTRS